MRSPWSAGLFLIIVGGLALVHTKTAPSRPVYALGILLIGGGISLFIRRRQMIYVALVSALVLIASGIVAWAGHPEWSMPWPPFMTVCIGLYLAARIAMVGTWMRPRKRFQFDDELTRTDTHDQNDNGARNGV